MSTPVTVTEAPTLVPPPRSTGNMQQDFPIIVDWTYRAYLAISAAIALITQDIPDITGLQKEADALKSINDGQISGTAVVSDPNNVVTITWATPQVDTDYRVIVQAISSTGTPALGSFVIVAKAYTTTTFSFTLAAAPGAASSVTFEYQLIRNT